VFTNPKENLKELELESGMSLVDFGSGSGNYALLSAPLVKGGRVYAVDIQRGLLEKIKKEAGTRGFSNVEIVWADLEKPESTGLRENSIDAAILANVLFLIEKKEILVDEIKRVLRKGGKLLFLDWADSFGGLGPQAEHVILEKEAKKLFEEKGFLLVKNLANPGDHHYGFILKLNG